MQAGMEEKKHRKQKRYQNIWTHGKGRKAERKCVVFGVETCRKTTAMKVGKEERKHRKQKRKIAKHLDTWKMLKCRKKRCSLQC